MNQEQLSDMTFRHEREISALQERVGSAHKRIDENDQITSGIHKLATNIETLAVQVKQLAEKLDTSVVRMEAGLKSQGERIGLLEKKPATRWESLVTQVIGLVVAAVVGFALSKFM